MGITHQGIPITDAIEERDSDTSAISQESSGLYSEKHVSLLINAKVPITGKNLPKSYHMGGIFTPVILLRRERPLQWSRPGHRLKKERAFIVLDSFGCDRLLLKI
jgi:hypothetical protein